MKENSLTRVEIVEEGKTIRMEREAPVAAPSFASAGSGVLGREIRSGGRRRGKRVCGRFIFWGGPGIWRPWFL